MKLHRSEWQESYPGPVIRRRDLQFATRPLLSTTGCQLSCTCFVLHCVVVHLVARQLLVQHAGEMDDRGESR